MLHGRDDEQARLAALVDSARAGRAAVLVVLGDPGVGKSMLLRALLAGIEQDRERPAVRVLATTGVASEAPLPFAALHRLLRPVLAWDRLPAPQARALRVAFGHEDGDGPVEPFLVGMATLSVLTDATDATPVLCIVDDAQWLDAASANALLFAARQLQADPVAMLFAARPGDGDGDLGTFHPDGLPMLHVGGLDRDAARRLLAERTGRPPPDDVADRLLAESGGNPLALLELPAELSPDQLSGARALPSRLALTERVERAFLERARRAGHEAQVLLLVAAADDTGRFSVVRAAAASLGVSSAGWDDAEHARLLSVIEGRVAVRHPLVRSALYQSATSQERRQAHAALAQALGDDRDRQTWHRALATTGLDPAVADALHEVAARAEQRGATTAAADAFERAAALTPTPRDRGARLFAAARNAWTAGDAARTGELCTAAGALADEPLLRADIDRLRGRIEINVGSAVEAHRIFTRAGEHVAARDPVRALELAVAAAVAQSYGADSGATLEAGTIGVSVDPDDTARTQCLKQLLVSTRHDIAGDRRAALAELHAAMAIALSAPDARGDRDLLGNLANAALHLGDDDAHRRFYALMLSTAREDGDGMRILYALQRLTFSQYVGGRWAELRGSSEEAVALGRGIGQDASTAAPQAWLTLLAALQGRPDYDARLATVEGLVAAHPPAGIMAQPVQDLIRWAQGVRALLAGAPGDAIRHFRQMRQPTLTSMAAPDRIDAAVRGDDRAQARTWVEELETFAAGTDLAWAQAAVAFGRAITLDVGGKEAVAWFETSLAHHADADRPYDRARVQLAYGEALRRSGRRMDARTHIRAALGTFEDLNADPLADRAGQELRASGETARRRDPSTLVDLTPMELKVTQLVKQGLSNKDVAAQCWVSPRTVAFHLRNVFTKLGVSSRGQLAVLDLA